jgi:hypothetical protein
MRENKATSDQIKTQVIKGLAVLAPQIREWVQGHSIEPHQIRLATDPDGTSFKISG